MEAVTVRRYPFPVAEWTRFAWTSPSARDLWQPRLHRISSIWGAAERASVGVAREACLQTISPEGLIDLSRKAVETGLELLILDRNDAGSVYSNAPTPLLPGRPWTYRVALVTRSSAPLFLNAWKNSDDDRLGHLLGYPPCCRAFFRTIWKEQGWRDTTWPMIPSPPSYTVSVKGPVECNILLRWLGVRWVPHLPCSFTCEASTRFGQQFRELVPYMESNWMDSLLDSPVEWSTWHGIAEIKTPILKISAKSEATAERLCVQRDGPRYPEGGAQGLVFPFRRTAKPLPLHFPSSYEDNGFSSQQTMDEAHELILSAIREMREAESYLDLGAGNGVLLGKIQRKNAVGIESQKDRVSRAQRAGRDVRFGRIQDVEQLPKLPRCLVLISEKRFEEFTEEEAQRVRGWLKENAEWVLLYSYEKKTVRIAEMRTDGALLQT